MNLYGSDILLIIFLLSISIKQINSSNEYLGSTSKHLFHFVHVTDIHVTHFGHRDRLEKFEHFCNLIIKSLIKPQVTVVSGDLTHNRDPAFSSKQFEEEWSMYKNILIKTNVTQHTAWLDIRGNHDAFMDADPNSIKSYYRVYSNQGEKNKGSYEYTLTTVDNDTYSFIALDMCPKPGVGRPFNFLGYINNEEIEHIGKLSRKTQNSNTTIVFGHYPLSLTYSNGLNKLLNHAIAYLNGHLHVFVKDLYARHSNGLLELELADWKESRRFRILTVDSGLLSFEDFHFDQSIYAVVSNPKAAEYKTPREPLYRLSQSTHIRILIFSKWPIVNVRVSIDSKYLGDAKQSIDNANLYVLEWNATLYNDELLHDLLVEIKDNQNNLNTIRQKFSLSTKVTISTGWILSRIVLGVHWPTLGMTCITLSLCVYILILIFYRRCAKRMTPNCRGCFSICNKIRQRMMLLCSIDLFYYSLIGLALYHFIGPWYIGYLTDGYIGFVFFWGIIIRGVLLPPDMQLYTGAIQIVLFLIPLTLCLCSSCYYRFTQLQTSRNLAESYLNKCLRLFTVYILFIYTILFVTFWSYVTTASYKLAWFISPFGLILAIFSLFLHIKSQRLKLEDFQFQPSMKSDSIHNMDETQELIDIQRAGMKDN